MQRYFAVNKIKDDIFLLEEDIHHIVNVMRKLPGQEIEVVFDGQLYICSILSIKPFKLQINKQESNCDSELPNKVTLFFALSKKDKIEFVIQKATELGASRIVLVNTNRCVTDFSNKDISKKLERYSKIAKEASEQSHRLCVPSIEGIYNLKDLKPLMCDINLLAYEKSAGPIGDSFDNLNVSNQTISVFVGSEGGFDPNEVDYLNSIGFKNISLGKRILRCETAAVYSLSVIASILEK